MRAGDNGSTPGPINDATNVREKTPRAGAAREDTANGATVAVPVEAHTPPSVMVDVESQKEGSTSVDEVDEAEPTYPEGGLQAWLVVFGAWCAMIVGLGLVNTIGPIQAYVSENQLKDYSEGTISWIFSLYVFLVFFCGLQIGPVFDAKGPRLLILGGSVLTVFCMMLLGQCTAYWHFIVVFSIIGGVGSSLLFTPAVAAISHYFNRRRSTATGLATTGGAIGGIIFPLSLQSLLPKLGFAWSTRIIGFIFLVLAIIANLLVRSRLPPKKTGLSSSVLPDLRIFLDGTGAFALVTAGTWLMELGLFVPISYLTSYCLANGVDRSFSYQMIAILSAGSVFGRYLPGILADRIGRFNTMIMMLFLCLVTVLGLWFPAADSGAIVPLVVVYAVIFGFASGSNISLTPTCVGQLCKTSEYGRYYATCYTVVSFATLIGVPIAGQLIEVCGGKYWGLILFTALSYVASLACFIVVRVRTIGWSLTAVW